MTNYLEEEYEVEKIIDKKIENGKTLYLVKWVGWDLSESTWEPQANLENSKLLIEKYEKSKKKHKASNKSKVTQTLFLSEAGSSSMNSSINTPKNKESRKNSEIIG